MNNNDNKMNDDMQYSEDDKIMYEVSKNANEGNETIEKDKKKSNINYTSFKKPKKKRKKKKGDNVLGVILVVCIIIAISIIIALAVIVFSQDMLGITGSDSEIPIEVSEGATLSEIADQLEKEGIITNANVFVLYAKISKVKTNFQYGEHELNDSMSYEQIIDELNNIVKEREQVRIMFREGITLYEAAQILEKNEVCDADDFIRIFNDYSEDLNLDFEKLVPSESKFYKMEGYLFPDTYDFYKATTDDEIKSIVEIIRLNFNNKVYTQYYAKMQELDLDLDEVITLASIVQSEAGHIEDMKMVSSVYWNRLNNSSVFPKLQSCPTRDYVDEIIIPNIEFADEDMNIAYNTYESFGLPPGAISNPGIDAIEAVLYPEETDYYFFCSNIETGEFFYAKTDAEHEANLVKAGLK